MPPLSMAKKLAVAANALYRVFSTRLKICPINGCSFMPNFPIFSTPQRRLFCLALPPCSLWTWGFQRCQMGCSCSADDASACFPICLIRYPEAIVPTRAFLFNIFTSFDIPGSSPNIVVLIFNLRLQLVSHPNQIHWFS